MHTGQGIVLRRISDAQGGKSDDREERLYRRKCKDHRSVGG